MRLLISGSWVRAPHWVRLGSSLWRNRLARSAVNRKVGGSSPPRDGRHFVTYCRIGCHKRCIRTCRESCTSLPLKGCCCNRRRLCSGLQCRCNTCTLSRIPTVNKIFIMTEYPNKPTLTGSLTTMSPSTSVNMADSIP